MAPVPAQKKSRVIGVISDTHGLVRPEAVRALQGADLVIHAGDIGTPDVLVTLGSIASVVAVRGNIDKDSWARAIPEDRIVPFGRRRIYVVHNLSQMRMDPAAEGIRMVISGHSHSPSITEKEGVVFFNPGSAGPRRFKLPVAVGRIRIQASSLKTEIVELSV